MRSLTWFGSAMVLAALGGCAEGQDASGPTGSGGSSTQQGGGGSSTSSLSGGGGAGASSTGGAGGSGGSVFGNLTYTGTILDGFSQMPIPAADVCALEPSLPCVQTDALGAFTYPGVPESTRVRVGASKGIYFPVESLIDTTTMNGTLSAFMVSKGLIEIAIDSLMLGYTFDNTKPAIAVVARDLANQTLPGYTVSVDPPTGQAPLYLTDAGDSIDPQLTATSNSGIAFIVNGELGTYDVNITGPAICNAAYIVDDTNQHTAPLINAALFVIVFDCQ